MNKEESAAVQALSETCADAVKKIDGINQRLITAVIYVPVLICLIMAITMIFGMYKYFDYDQGYPEITNTNTTSSVIERGDK